MKAIIVVLFTFFITNVNAQKNEEYETYNVKRALEEINNGKIESAKEFLEKELKENEKNPVAQIWMSAFDGSNGDYGKGLNRIDNALKYLRKSQKKHMALAYLTKAKIYEAMNENMKALYSYTEAIKYTPDDIELYNNRGSLLYEIGEYESSYKDFKKMISMNSDYVYGYMGLGQNEYSMGKYKDAIENYNYAEKLSNEFSCIYAYRAMCYYELKNHNKAADDAIKALSIDGSGIAFDLIKKMFIEYKDLIITKLRIKQNKSTSDPYWPYCIGYVYENNNDYASAIENYKESLKYDNDAAIFARISTCYQQIGNNNKALEYNEYALAIDSTNIENILSMADIYYELGNIDKAISQMSKFITRTPDFFYGYYRRGFYKDNAKDYDGAIEDYSIAIVQNPGYTYAYLGRGDMYRMKDETEKAMADYNKVIELDSVPNEQSCAQYAYMELGNIVKAKEFMDKILATIPDDPGAYYDAACLYSRLGECDKSLEFLETAFKKGFLRFEHINNDDDLDSIKKNPKFKSMINEYKLKMIDVQDKFDDEDNDKGELYTIDVPFKKDGSSYIVKCAINGLPLNFVFDTGASDISISDVEANFMYKNNYLNKSDILGKQNYMTADGSISEGTVINLKNINIGGLELNNVRASVVKNQRAPLLLGQSVLSRLGKIAIDNDNSILNITYRKLVK